jgi:hypothetical protein
VKYTIEMSSGAMICIPSFIKIGVDIQRLLAENTDRHTEQGDVIGLLLFFKECRLSPV